MVQSKHSLSKDEQRIKHHLDNSPLGVVEWDTNYIVTRWSNASERIFGWAADETIGKNINDLNIVYKEDIPIVMKTMDKMSEDKESSVVSTNRNVTRSGEVIICKWYNTVLFDEEGKMISVMSLVDDITERVRVNIALEESEKKYRELVWHAAAGIYEIDFKTRRFTSVNDAMAMVTGYSVDELLSMDAMDILDDESKVRFKERIRKGMKGERTEEDVSYRIKKKDGTFLYVALNVKFRLERGRIIGASVVGHDITERVKTEMEFRESEERLRFALQTSNIGAWEIDLVNFKAFRSIEHANIFGYKDLSSDWSFDIFIGHVIQDDRQRVYSLFKKALETGDDLNFECRINRTDGETRWIWAAARHYKFAENRNPRIAGIVQDITERKKIESDLREAQQRLDLVLENASIGVWEWNTDTDKIKLDERTARMAGFDPNRSIFERFEIEKQIDIEDIPHFHRALQDVVGKKLPLETIFRLNKSIYGNRYLSVKGFPVQGNKMMGVFIDVTDLKEGTSSLVSRLNADLLRSNRDLESFAYIASHDLQEPLRMVSSFTQLLEKNYGGNLDANAREYIRFAVEGAKRMHDQINGLLAYSRIGTREQEYSMVDMNKVVQNVISNLRMLVSDKQITVVSDNLNELKADEGQMTQLMQNLIGNAVKFSDNGTIVRVGSREEKGMLIFSIKDEGIGIEPQYHQRIFEIFQRLHPKEKYEGTGIGLSICKRIVERHGGQIWIESSPGKGSTFFFSIPQKNA